MENAVLNVKKGQNITIVIEGYEDHRASFDYDDVLQVILTQAQSDLNKRRAERQRLKNENHVAYQKFNAADSQMTASQNYPGIGLYPCNT